LGALSSFFITFAPEFKYERTMKKVIFTVFLCLATIGSIQAKRTHIIMRIPTSSYKSKKHGYIRHAHAIRANIPIVELDDNNISISSLQAGSNVSLILNDEQGNIVYENISTSSSSCLTIEIPAGIIEQAFSIQITVNGIDYIGEIY